MWLDPLDINASAAQVAEALTVALAIAEAPGRAGVLIVEFFAGTDGEKLIGADLERWAELVAERGVRVHIRSAPGREIRHVTRVVS